MAEIAEAYVSLLPSAKGFGSNLKSSIGGEVGKTGKSMGGAFSKAFGAAAAIGGGAAVAGFLKGSLDEAREAQKVGAQTAAVIKSTGGAANVSRAGVEKLSAAISRKVGIDDEAIQSGANLLLTFTNVRNEAGKGNKVFDATVQAATDMSVALGTDTKAAAMQLGKALNDPIKGVTKLQRSGVTFTDQQKDQIETLVKSGKTLDAQKIILREVNKEFGGSAEAQATAGDKMRVAFGNIQEAVGTALLPLVDKVANAFVKLAPRIEGGAAKIGPLFSRISGAAGPLVDILGDVISKLGPVADKVGEFVRENPTFVRAFAIALGVLAAAIGGVTLATTLFSIALNSTGIPIIVIAIAALVAGLVVAYKRSERFREIVDSVAAGLKEFGGFLKSDVLPVIRDLAATVAAKARPVIKQLGETFRNDVLPVIQQVIAKFREWQPGIQKAIGVVARLVAGLVKFYVTVLSKVLPPVIRFVGFLISKLVPAGLRTASIFIRVVGAVIRFGAAVVAAIGKVAAFVRGAITRFNQFVAFVASVPVRVVRALASLAGALRGAFSKAFSAASGAVRTGVDKVVGFVKDIPGKITKQATKFLNAGKTVGGKIIDGVLAGVRAIGSGIGNIAGELKSAINNAIGLPKHLSFSVLGKNVGFTIPGFARGVRDFSGGLAMVGERGPELVSLPKGSDVYSNTSTRGMLRDGGLNPVGGPAGGSRFELVLDDGTALSGYMRRVADGSVGFSRDLAGQRSRARYVGLPA